MPKPAIEVIARGLIQCGDWVLLCRNIKRGYLYLPGGHVEFGEAASEALARELKEEAGLTLLVGSFLLATEGLFESGGERHHEVNLLFHVKHPSWTATKSPPKAVPSLESHIAFDWVRINEVGEVDLRPRPIQRWIVRWHQQARKRVPRGTMPWISATK